MTKLVKKLMLVAAVALAVAGMGAGNAQPAIAEEGIAPTSLVEEVEDTFKNFSSSSRTVYHYDVTTRRLVFRTSYRYDGAKKIGEYAGTYGSTSGTIRLYKQIYYTW